MSSLAVILLMVIYMSYILIVYGSPLEMTVRQYLKSGNELNADSLFTQALKPYSQAIAKDSSDLTVCYNSASNIISNNLTLKKDGRDVENIIADYCDADRLLEKVINNDTLKVNIVNSLHNRGLIYHMIARDDTLNRAMNRILLPKEDSLKYDDNVNNLTIARDFYREALRIDPGNDETRYNLAVVQKLLEKDNQGGGGGANNKKDNDENGENDQQNQQGNNDQQDEQEQKEKQNQQQQHQQQQQRLLKTIRNNEKKTREKMNVNPVSVGEKDSENKNYNRGDLEKNW